MKGWGLALRLLSIGWYIALCIVLGAFAGYWLDNKYDLGVWVIFVGLTLGLALALFGAYQMIRQAMKEK